jgi:hypothetical protein
MKPQIQCVRTHWNPGFTASGAGLPGVGREGCTAGLRAPRRGYGLPGGGYGLPGGG